MAFIACAFGLCIFLALACSLIFKGSYLSGFVCLLPVIGALLLFFDALFSERLIFYSDRMEKVWRIFGARTIYYLNAEVTESESGMFWIVETDANGRRLRTRIPIFVQDSLFSFKVGGEVDSIIDYLTEGKRFGKRFVKKPTLDKEALDSYVRMRNIARTGSSEYSHSGENHG